MNNPDAYKKRKYNRHPAGIPIEISLSDLVAHKKEYLINISRGGLCFRSMVFVNNDTPIDIKVPLTRPVFQTRAHVVWCRRSGSIYEVGVEFADQEDPLKIRMVEQICDIEHYKRDIYEKEGRTLTSEQAALEWIKKYADTFSEEK